MELDIIIGIMVGLAISLFLYCYGDMKRAIIKKSKNKRYEKLWTGEPKHTVFVNDWDTLFEYRNYPFKIGRHTYGLNFWDSWHCNDDSKYINKGNESNMNTSISPGWGTGGINIKTGRYPKVAERRNISVNVVLEVW